MTGVLGLIWNIGSLGAQIISDPASLAARVITAVAYAALGFLPAVVVHSVLRSDVREGRGRRCNISSGSHTA